MQVKASQGYSSSLESAIMIQIQKAGKCQRKSRRFVGVFRPTLGIMCDHIRRISALVAESGALRARKVGRRGLLWRIRPFEV